MIAPLDDDKTHLSTSRVITAHVQKPGAHVENLAPADLSKLLDRIFSNEKFEAFNPHLTQEDLEGLRSSVPRLWPQRNVPVFAPFSDTNKKLGYCQVRRNVDEKVFCHRLTFAEWLATQEVILGKARKAFVPSLDVSHGLDCGLNGRNINPRSMVQEKLRAQPNSQGMLQSACRRS